MTDGYKSLAGRAAIVTGGSRGIGRAVCAELASQGADVLAVARDPEALEALAAEEDVRTLAADVSTPEGCAAVESAARRAFGGRLEILVNNVGGNIRKPTADWSGEDFERLVSTNLRSAWDLSVRLRPLLAAGRAPAVVNLSSVSAQRAVRTSTAVYALTKGGLEAMTRFLACEWGPDGIRVNAVAPWYVVTPLANEVLKDPEKMRAILARTPLGRLGQPEDVARAVAFLAGPSSAWITGVVLPVDGGFSALGS